MIFLTWTEGSPISRKSLWTAPAVFHYPGPSVSRTGRSAGQRLTLHLQMFIADISLAYLFVDRWKTCSRESRWTLQQNAACLLCLPWAGGTADTGQRRRLTPKSRQRTSQGGASITQRRADLLWHPGQDATLRRLMHYIFDNAHNFPTVLQEPASPTAADTSIY